MWRYLVSSSFGQAVMENWQSEYLQFTTYILLTVWVVQKGSPESKKVDEVGPRVRPAGRRSASTRPRTRRAGRARGGCRLRVYSNSLVLVMGPIWLGRGSRSRSTGWSAYNVDQLDHHEATVTWLGYLGSADFWQTTLQNWQSEFLAVGSMAVLSIYLRQRGSPESKPVGAPHEATGVEG